MTAAMTAAMIVTGATTGEPPLPQRRVAAAAAGRGLRLGPATLSWHACGRQTLLQPAQAAAEPLKTEACSPDRQHWSQNCLCHIASLS